MEDLVEDEPSGADSEPFDPAPRGSGVANRRNLADTQRKGTGLRQVTSEVPEATDPASGSDSEERELQEQLARLRRDKERKKEAARKKREEEEARQREAEERRAAEECVDDSDEPPAEEEGVVYEKPPSRLVSEQRVAVPEVA